jgi:hypothetical protein
MKRVTGKTKTLHWLGQATALIMVALVIGCGSSKKKPSIANLNSATTPSSPVGLAIEINGTGFQSAPGQVIFTQNGITATVTPAASAWSDTGIVAVVPSGNGTTSFTVPGSVTVTVKTSGGTSNGANLALVQTVTFSPNNVTWTTTTTLPAALTGLRAVAVPASSTSSFVVVAGGYNGTANVNTVYANTLATDGTVGGSWTAIPTQPLPASRAHHGMVIAHAGNSLVPASSAFVYVIGGQANSTDAPGGTNTVYMASVNLTTGSAGAWTTLTNTLPQPLVAPAVALYNGHIYVVGGLTTSGAPSNTVYSAAVQQDGTLGAWSTSTNAYPVSIAFGQAFGFGGNLYVLNGDMNASSDPNAQSPGGIPDVRFASAHNGVVGTWTQTQSTIKAHTKNAIWLAFGQIINAEGIYSGSPGSSELERSSINADATLASWNGITASVNQIGANVYNATAIVSPLQSPSGNPRFLLLGGQAFTSSPPGALSNKVYVNNAP